MTTIHTSKISSGNKMAALGPKRSLFSTPTWASSSASSKTKTSEDSAAPSIFQHRVYEGILEAERKRKDEEAEKLRANVILEAQEKQNDIPEPKHKKRRISTEPVDNFEEEPVSPVRYRRTKNSPSAGSPASATTGTRSTESPKSAQAVIQIEDDEEDPDMCGSPLAQATVSKAAKPRMKLPIKPPDSDDDDDDYTRELKRKARERLRLQAVIAMNRLQYAGESSRSTSRELKSPVGDDFDADIVSPAAAEAQTSLDDPLLRILITPRIANTNPLIVNRRASQNMEMVHKYWCKRQGLDQAASANVVMAWRGTRLWNSSTMQGPLKQLRKERSDETFDVSKEDPSATGEQKGARIELEAMTEEQYDDYLARQEREAAVAAKRASGNPKDALHPDEPGTNSHHDGTTEDHNSEKPKKKGFVIALHCKDREPFKLNVYPNSTISKVMRAYRMKMGTKEDENKTPWLTFDGERLGPDLTIEDTDIEAGDAIEVHFR